MYRYPTLAAEKSRKGGAREFCGCMGERQKQVLRFAQDDTRYLADVARVSLRV